MNDDPTKVIDTAAAIARLHHALETDKVSCMEIYHISQFVVRSISVSSTMLETESDFYLVTKRLADSPVAADFLNALHRAQPSPSGHVADLRWGCVFRYEDGSRVLAVYFDVKGKRGVIDGACYTFESAALAEWAESVFPKWME